MGPAWGTAQSFGPVRRPLCPHWRQHRRLDLRRLDLRDLRALRQETLCEGRVEPWAQRQARQLLGLALLASRWAVKNVKSVAPKPVRFKTAPCFS